MDIKNLISSSNARMLLPNAALRFLRLLCVVALFSPVRSADAQKWDFEPYIELAATYTTNLFLAEEGLEESDYIGQLVPGFSVVRDEGRFTTNTEYRALGLFFASDSDLNTVYHQLRSASTINTVAERFFIDVNAAIEQAVVDPTATIPTSNVPAMRISVCRRSAGWMTTTSKPGDSSLEPASVKRGSSGPCRTTFSQLTT